MDTLAIAAIGIGLLAAIGVAFVAMSENGTSETQPEQGTQTAAPVPAAQPVVATAAVQPTIHATFDQLMTAPLDSYPLFPLTSMHWKDPLHTWLGRQVQLLTGELQKLRQQEQALEQRLKLINGIAVLIEQTERGSGGSGSERRQPRTRQPRGNNHVSSAAATRSTEQVVPASAQ